LIPLVDRIIVTRARHPRSMPTSLLAKSCRAAGMQPTIVERPEDAVQAAWSSQSALTLITGSLFLVGDVLEWLWQESRAQPSAESPTSSWTDWQDGSTATAVERGVSR
jgi:folylpolyglutamate synthase/dihydropteroate synthase